jgi:HlyD family type I secretion membrane fusion protein
MSSIMGLPDFLVDVGSLPLASTDFRRPIQIGGAVIALALGGFATWAATAPLDSAVMASGIVSVESKRKVVQHREGGIVDRLLVKEGDKVAAGDVLVRLRDAGAEAQMAGLSDQRDAKQAEQARLTAERDGLAEIAFPSTILERAGDPRMVEILDRERDRFGQRRTSMTGQLEILDSRIDQLEAQRSGHSHLEESKQRQIVLLKDELSGLRGLTAKGYYPVNRLRASERDLARLEGERYSDSAGTTQVDREIAEARLQIIQTRQKFREEVVTDLSRVENELNDLGQKLVASHDSVDRLAVVSPVDGIVQSLKVAGPGAVVPPGGDVAEIVPGGDRLVVEAQISPHDIDRVHDGQPVRLRFTSFASRQTPVVDGHLTVVSADRFTDQATHQGYYTARVEVAPDQVSRLPGTLKAGMPVDVMVEGGERTMLEYMVKPLSDSFAKAFKER